MTSLASTELLHSPEHQFATVNNPEQLVLAQQGLVDVLMQAYLRRGVVNDPNDTVKRLVMSDVLDSPTFKSRVASVVEATGNNFSPAAFDAVGHAIYEGSQEEAFTLAYAYRSFQRAVNGKKLRRDQLETLPVLARGLNTKNGPATFYGEVSRMWATAVGEALDNTDPKAAAQSLSKIHEIATLLSPEDDHPSNRASIATIGVLQKIAAGEKYTDYEYRRISRLANAHVPTNVRRLAQPATDNYVELVENISAHITSNRSSMTPGQLKRYCRLLKSLRVEVDFTVPDDAAAIEELEQQNDDPIIVKGESTFDDVSGRVEPVKINIRTTPKKYDVLFKTGVAAALAGTAVVATLPIFNYTASGPKNETVVAQPPKADQPPAPATDSPPVITPEVPTVAPQPEVITNTNQPPTPAQIEAEPTPPKPYEPHQNNQQPPVQEITNPADLPTLQLSETAQPVRPGEDDKANPAITPEAVNNAIEEDLLGEATDEMAAYLLQFNPEVSISKHDKYVDDVELLTARADKRLAALNSDGHLSDDKYHAYRQLVVKARVLAFFPGLPLESMGVKPNDLATSEFAQAYIKTYLEKNIGLGEHSDVPNFNLINAMIAEAATIVTPASAQADILAHINSENIYESKPNDSPSSNDGAGQDGGVNSSHESSNETKGLERYMPLLNLIAGPESGGNYNAYYNNGGNTKIDFTSMTVQEVIEWQTDFRDSGSASTAVGKYQFLQKTLIAMMEQHKLSYETKFDKDFQDRLAYHLLEKRGLRGYMNGGISAEEFAHNLSMEWASLPTVTGPSPEASYYAGDGLNQSHISVSEIMDAVSSLKPDGGPQDSPENSGHTNGVPNNPHERINFFADKLGISSKQIHLSTSSAGLFHFTIDPSAYTKLGIKPLGGYPKELQVADSSIASPRNFYIGQCVDYVAFMIDNDKYPGGMPNWGGNYVAPYQGGHATAWEDNASVDDIRVDNQLSAGAVLQWDSEGGPEHTRYGHVGYIHRAFEGNWGVYSQMNYDGKAGWNVEVISPQMIEKYSAQINVIHTEEGIGKNQKNGDPENSTLGRMALRLGSLTIPEPQDEGSQINNDPRTPYSVQNPFEHSPSDDDNGQQGDYEEPAPQEETSVESPEPETESNPEPPQNPRLPDPQTHPYFGD